MADSGKRGIRDRVKQIKCVRIQYHRIMMYRYWKRFKRDRRELCERIIQWCESTPENRMRFKEEAAWLKKNGAAYFPYPWADLKFIRKIKIGFDPEGDVYVWHKGDRLYINPHQYTHLALEQNERSAHRYIGVGAGKDWPEKGSVFVDVGAAEGIMGLECIRQGASEIYLIERDEYWIKRLKKTFQGFENVRYIYKYASDRDDEEYVSLDTLLAEVTKPILIKIDVEGMEKEVLRGGTGILQRENVKLVVACYHRPDDAGELERYLRDFGFRTEFSEGYFALMTEDAEPPYLRKGVIRAWKERPDAGKKGYKDEE